jgi:hypothetical protein
MVGMPTFFSLKYTAGINGQVLYCSTYKISNKREDNSFFIISLPMKELYFLVRVNIRQLSIEATAFMSKYLEITECEETTLEERIRKRDLKTVE